MKLIQTNTPEATALIAQIEARSAVSTARVEPVVAKILADIQSTGDSALLEYATRFDHLESKPLRVTPAELEQAWNAITPELQLAMRIAQANIRAFAQAQKPEEWVIELEGLTTGQLVRPIAAVGCYVPGGRYPLPSTVFMTVIPAQVAGVPRIAVCSPNPAPETLAAVYLASLNSASQIEFYRVGGAQAIAALAYGTATIAPVNKIVGPGNLYVTASKQLVAQHVGIDMPAGPTEIGICTGGSGAAGNPAGLAADLVAQAEHDPESLAVLITPDAALAEAVLREVASQSATNPIAQQSLAANGYLFVTQTLAEAQTLTNRLAFEHLSVDSMADLAWVQNAGSVFVGPHSPQSMGDYISGPNHVLPTGRAGRMRGGLAVTDFLKVITLQHYTPAALAQLGPHAIRLAGAEGLTAHANSIRVKLDQE